MENADSGKKELPIWCETCDQQGYIYLDDPDQPAFVVCSRCGFEASQVWCPKCGMGGDFIRNIEDRPMSWVCTGCKTRYKLPASFYETPVHLYMRDELVAGTLRQGQPFVSSTKLVDLLSYVLLGGVFIIVIAISWRYKNYLILLVFPLIYILVAVLSIKIFEMLKKIKKSNKNNI